MVGGSRSALAAAIVGMKRAGYPPISVPVHGNRSFFVKRLASSAPFSRSVDRGLRQNHSPVKEPKLAAEDVHADLVGALLALWVAPRLQTGSKVTDFLGNLLGALVGA